MEHAPPVRSRSGRSAPRRRWSLVLAATGLLVLAGAVPAAARPDGPAPRCLEGDLAVATGPGAPASERTHFRLCPPTNGSTDTVQVLVPGITYNHRYWDIPDPDGGDRYSYVAHARAAGSATLQFDQLGTGQSSHPVSAVLQFPTYAHVLHQLVAAVRAGALPGQQGGFDRVVTVGHSLGSVVSWLEASTYKDVDALIATGATHDVRLDRFAVLPTRLGPAAADPAFAGRVLDPGYLTTLPGQRAAAFYDPGRYDPRVAAWDEANKDLGSYPALVDAASKLLLTPLDIRVPVLVVAGDRDVLLCGDPLRLQGADCSSDASLAASERPHLGPEVPSVDGYVLKGAGHDINAMLDAPDWFAAAQEWLAVRR